MTPAVTVADLLEAAAARHPEATAVEAGGRSLTYAGLDARAGRLARRLRGLGVGADVRVGLCLDRSVELAVALWAVLEAGGACVPLDPAYPPERLGFMVEDAAVAAVVTRSGLAPRLPAGAAPVLDLDGLDDLDDSDGPPPRDRTAGPEDAGYVIYTSGSTGRPKGVLLTHRGLVSHHRAAVDLYALGPGDRVLQFCSLGFDASIEEMFPTWAAGATVVFRPDDLPLLGRGWTDWLRRQGITVLNLPTAYWHEWARDLDARGDAVPEAVRLVVVGGEKARGPVYRTWARLSGGRSRWVNAYGPTETTCMSTVWEGRLDAEAAAGERWEERDPPIGRPLPGTVVRVVDERLAPVPAGATGELLIGGPGLARGYLNQPELTAERFVDDPAPPAGRPPGRMYRTGDLVRLLPGGDLDYVGRIDDQVKIRGFRIECGEVEAALARHPAVAAAAVVARQEPPDDRRLVAYVVPAGGAEASAADLRRFVGRRLPDHMVPAAVVVLDALPLTPNGKVDRAALPAPAPPAAPAPAPAAGPPRTPLEEAVAAIWARVLGRDAATFGVDDDFFELGGHSLLATQVVAQIREELGTDTPLRAIFSAPTVAGLAAVVEAERPAASPGPPLAPRPAPYAARAPLSWAQDQMWRLEVAADPPGLFNITVLRDLDGAVDLEALRAALGWLAGRHEILRTGFVEEDGQLWQRIVPAAEVEVELGCTDLPADPGPEGSRDLQRRVAEQDARPFDLDRPPLFRAHLFRPARDGPARLAVTLDHLVGDGTAAFIVMDELSAAYRALSAGRAPELPAPALQFADFALWQRRHVTEEVLARQLDWWAGALAGSPLGPAVPFDHVPGTPTRRIGSRSFTVGPETRRLLDEVARATGSTLFVVALAAVQALLRVYAGTTDVVLSTTVSGRNRVELEGLVGMFSGIGRIRGRLDGDPTFTEVAGRARDYSLGMFENQDVPFMRVRRAVLPEFPADPVELAKVLPVDFEYFYTGTDWSAGSELFFRGQLHPLGVLLEDDGARIRVQLSYKADFYEASTVEDLAAGLERVLEAVARQPWRRLSELPVPAPTGER